MVIIHLYQLSNELKHFVITKPTIKPYRTYTSNTCLLFSTPDKIKFTVFVHDTGITYTHKYGKGPVYIRC